MTRKKPSLFARHDTFLGVCEGLGQDFGFNANWLRLAFAVALLLSPVATAAAYVGIGVVIFASRLIFPPRATAPVAAAPAAVELQGVNDAEQIELAKAA